MKNNTMSEKKTTTFRITTCMRGLQKWIDAHPRKNLRGFFTVDGRDMSHNEVKRVVAYAVEKGYETERDIPSEELENLLDKR